jgi:hypothetical protein
MGRRFLLGITLVLVLLPVWNAGQQQPSQATVHIVVVDGIGRDLGEAKVDSFKDMGRDRDLAGRFQKNATKGIPYGVYQVRVDKTGFFTGQMTTQVFQPDVWVVVGLRVGEELPMFPEPRLQLAGTVKNFGLGEEPIHLRLVAVYSDFMLDARVKASGQMGTFTLAGIIPDGTYILITIGRTRILDVRQLKLEFPAKDPIVIDLGQRENQTTEQH